MTISTQLSRLCLSIFGLMIQEFGLIQIVGLEITFDEDMCCVETSLLVFTAKRLFGFCMVRDIIEGDLWTFCGFINITLFTHLCFRLIELMSVAFFLYLICCLIIVQECVKLFRLKMPSHLVQYRGAFGVFNNCKFTNKLQYKHLN